MSKANEKEPIPSKHAQKKSTKKVETPVETMTVVANAVGYFDTYRQPGDEFEVPVDTKKATWFEPVDGGWDEEPAKKSKGEDLV